MNRSPTASPRWLWAEAVFLFVLWPGAAIFIEGVSKFLLFAIPFLYAGAVYWIVRPALPLPSWSGWKGALVRMAAAVPVMAAVTLWLAPEWWLAFPRERPLIWGIVMALYPFLSAWPQEFLYRRFFFWRYGPLFGKAALMIAANALLFAWLHVMYENWPAFVLSAIAGVFFALTYSRSRNLTLVWIEHALYGQIAFTMGLGRFFYEGPS